LAFKLWGVNYFATAGSSLADGVGIAGLFAIAALPARRWWWILFLA